MQLIHQDSAVYTLNFERGDRIVSLLQTFLEQEQITAAHLTGLGAASEIEIAYYNLDTKTYERTTITENLEIVSLVGNVGVKEDGGRVIHIHGTFGRHDLSVVGGHVFDIVVSGAGEVHLTALSGTIHRTYDDTTGLTLMCPVENS
ncbi:DUF296 domain-containing protein [Candidatus Kaiserbacteria bacterium]|nr:DUF296 domain-containing protein [Candidatus Kaiserbacteria bacterium]